jgi:hypothetical protein
LEANLCFAVPSYVNYIVQFFFYNYSE